MNNARLKNCTVKNLLYRTWTKQEIRRNEK